MSGRASTLPTAQRSIWLLESKFAGASKDHSLSIAPGSFGSASDHNGPMVS